MIIQRGDDRRVILNGIDITQFIIDLPATPLVKGAYGELPTYEDLEIVVTNRDRRFTPDNKKSFFYGRKLASMTLRVFQRGEIIWNGSVTDASVDWLNGTVKIVGKERLQRLLDKPVVYQSGAMLPSEAIRQILLIYGLDVDPVSFGQTASVLDDIPVEIRVAPAVLTWAGTTGELLQQLATAGLLRLFVNVGGSIGVDTYINNKQYKPRLAVQSKDILGFPETEIIAREAHTDYSVTHLYGVASSAAGAAGALSLDFGANAAVQVTSEAAAHYIGSQWIAYSGIEWANMKLPVRKQLGQSLQLGQSVVLLIEQAGHNGTVAEIVGIDDAPKTHTLLYLQYDRSKAQ